jgi:hypothetical protein
MATTLYLKSSRDNGIDGYYDLYPVPGIFTDTASVLSVASGTEKQWQKNAGSSPLVAWITPPLSDGFTLTSVDAQLRALESNVLANCGARMRLFKYSGGSESEIGGGPFDDGVEFTASAVTYTWTANVTDTAFAAGDRLVVKFYITNIGTMAEAYTCTMQFNQPSTATFITLAETVTFDTDPYFVNFSSYDSASSASAVVNKPTNTANNDIMFALVSKNGTVDPSTVPAGWNLIARNLQTANGSWLYYKVASSEDSSYTWEWAAAGKVRISMVTYRGGFDYNDPIDNYSNTAYTTGAVGLRAASFNVAAANSLLLYFGEVFYTSSVMTLTPPTLPTNYWSEDVDAGHANSDFAQFIGHLLWTGSGDSGLISGVLSASSTTKHLYVVSLNPEAESSVPKTIGGVNYASLSKIGNIAKANIKKI